MRRVLLVLLTAAVMLLPWASAAAEEAVPSSYTRKMKTTTEFFGTACALCLYDDYTRAGAIDRYESVWARVKEILGEIDNALSVSIADSEIARFNALSAGESMAVSELTAQVWQKAMEMYERTGGRFNPAVCPLVDLWGFSPRFFKRKAAVQPYDRVWGEDGLPAPDPAWIEAFQSLADPEGIVLSGSAAEGYRLTKCTPAVEVNGVTVQAQIDLGGIAKGYAVDRVEELLRAEGYAYGYFSCGSSSMCLLKSAARGSIEAQDPAFQLYVRSPRTFADSPESYAALRVQDLALSSSGDYDNNYMLGDDVCCHIIDAATGYPLNVGTGEVQAGISTVTLLSGSAAEDDALTTALCLMGPRGAIEYINEHLPDRDVVLVLYRADREGCEVVTNLSPDRIEILDGAYRIASEVDDDGRIVYCGTFFPELL